MTGDTPGGRHDIGGAAAMRRNAGGNFEDAREVTSVSRRRHWSSPAKSGLPSDRRPAPAPPPTPRWPRRLLVRRGRLSRRGRPHFPTYAEDTQRAIAEEGAGVLRTADAGAPA